MARLVHRQSSSTGSSGGGGGDGTDGLIVTNWANWDPDAASIISLDINSTLPRKTSTGASITFADESWWNGTAPVATLRPPTVADGYCGFGDIAFWKNATKNVKQINVRKEYTVSAAYCGDAIGHPKFLIMRVYPQFNNSNPGTAVRPMLFLENMLETGNPSIDLHDTIFLCHSENTYRYFSATNIVPGPTEAEYNDVTGPARGAIMRQPFYHGVTSGSDLSGNPIIAALEVVIVEMRVNVMATGDEPNGIIAYRLYRRNGQVFERGCSWLWEQAGKTVGANNYIADIDVVGGGYYNQANSGDPNVWTKVGRRMTFGFNLQPSTGRYWMGPPTGFVQ